MSSVVCVVFIVVGVVVVIFISCVVFVISVVRLFLGLFVELYVCLLLFGYWLIDFLCSLLFV